MPYFRGRLSVRTAGTRIPCGSARLMNARSPISRAATSPHREARRVDRRSDALEEGDRDGARRAMTGELIGREGELSVIQAFLDRPAEGPRALVLEGEAGIGKSTLWLAGVAAARERAFRVVTSRPAEVERTLPFVVLGDLFADAEPAALAALPAPRRRAFESALLREDPELPVDPRALGVAIVNLLPILAAGGPLVLAIDDDQWIDPSSAVTLKFALRRSPRQSVLLLVSRRSDRAAATALEESIDPAAVGRLEVGPLSVGAIQALIQSRLGLTFPRPTLLRLHELSGGNPFYSLELARVRSMDPARDPTGPLAVPPSLERLVSTRLGAFDAQTRQALLLISAHGRLPVALLRPLHVAPETLDQARAANVILTAAGVVGFTHPLLASALYQGATAGERHAAHRLLAEALVDPVDRGRHLALGAEEPDDELAAALESASNVARDRGMPIAAAELAEHALRLTPADALDHRHHRAMGTARAHAAAGEARRARAIADDLKTQAPKGPRRAEAFVLAADLAEPSSAVALLQQALVEAAGEPTLAATIHARLAAQGSMTKGRAWAERHARSSLRLAERLDDDTLRADALATLAILRFYRGDPHALELADQAYRLARDLGDPRLVKVASLWMGLALMSSGSYGRAREWLERQLSEWGDRDEQVRSEILWSLALVEFWSGRWSIASGYADEIREIAVQYGETPTDHLPPALVALHRGQIVSARDHSRRAMTLAHGHLLPQHLAVLGVCDLWSGSPPGARIYFNQAEETADIRGWDEPNMRWWRSEYVEALLQLGQVDDAARLVASWQGDAQRLGRERVLAQTLRCRGLITAARGDLLTAQTLLEEAVEQHGTVGDPFGRGRALLALGTVRLRLRRKRAARAALEAALNGFEALGAAGWGATARAALARVGGRGRIEGLSPSELRVATLVAEGRTNREVASTLFLGERTVSSHLTHIYAKLGVRSRTELARHVLPDLEPSAGDSSKVPTS
jgi:DNA-binding CsgD family transcriptional regulator